GRSDSHFRICRISAAGAKTGASGIFRRRHVYRLVSFISPACSYRRHSLNGSVLMSKPIARSWTPAVLISLVAAGLILSLSMGLRQSLGLFMEPMVRTTGITVATFGFAMAVQNLAWGIG